MFGRTTPLFISIRSPSVNAGSPLNRMDVEKLTTSGWFGSTTGGTILPASSPKSTPRTGIPAGTELGSRAPLLRTITPKRADRKSPSRNRGAAGLGPVPSVEKRMSISLWTSISASRPGLLIQSCRLTVLARSRNRRMLPGFPTNCTASSPRSPRTASNAARRATLGMTPTLVMRRSPAVNWPRWGLSSSVEKATR